MKHNGFFITFEKTCDGLGGTTQAKRLYERLKQDGYDVVLSREPGGTKLGDDIRYMLLEPEAYFEEGYEVAPATELLGFIMDRAQHHFEKVQPVLSRGGVFISDRYEDSTEAYQGEGKGWSEEVLHFLHEVATNGLTPNTTIVLDGTPMRDLTKGDRFDRSDKEFFQKVRRKMLSLAASSDRYALINANRPIEQNEEEIYKIVINKMREVGYESNMPVL